MGEKIKSLSPALKIYFLIIALSALAAGLSGGVLSNYFKDVYQVTAEQRGFIEFPRELPGVLTIFVIALIAGFSDIKIAMFANVLGIVGVLVLGLFTPSYNVMLIFIFIHSMGSHMAMPLRDAIGMDLIKKGNIGKRMGQYKGVYTGFTMIAGLVVFIGYRAGLFSFESDIKWVFVVAAIVMSVVLFLYSILSKMVDHKIVSDKRVKFIFRKEYKFYYVLTVMYGVQKQIMLVYGPWVLIELLNKKVDTLSILSIIGSLVGIFFIPALGKWIDQFGVKKLLYADALSFIGVYILYGILSALFKASHIPVTGLPVLMAYILFIVDKMSNQMGMIRTLYLKSILVKPSDFTPTLSLGLSLDHVVSISCAILAGIIWDKIGPQYIFFIAAVMSLVNLYVATKVEVTELN
ncbi:MAG: MFS transporter [Clostridiales bacterium]|nr:MFS transporter [Clostridiales bacterium]